MVGGRPGYVIARPLAGIRVLLSLGDAVDLGAYVTVLAGAGADVRVASQDALGSEPVGNAWEPHLVLVDASSPEQFLLQFRKRIPRVRIIAVAAATDDFGIRGPGCDGSLVKPVPVERLVVPPEEMRSAISAVLRVPPAQAVEPCECLIAEVKRWACPN